jgi:protocatechuate 3,4-dioxygenase beta subunit
MKTKSERRFALPIYLIALIIFFTLGIFFLTGCSTPTPTQAPTTVPTQLPPTSNTTARPTTAPTTSPTQAASTSPTCPSPVVLTPAMTEGPYYKANTPERKSLFESGMPGTKLVLTGFVLTTECKPVANAWLDFWQADSLGAYDNSGYRLRGHQFTDALGRYQLDTVVPGLYPGRTEHIHFKVRAPNGPIVTSQLFFPDVPANKSDSIFDQKLVLNIHKTNDVLNATYNFVVSVR